MGFERSGQHMMGMFVDELPDSEFQTPFSVKTFDPTWKCDRPFPSMFNVTVVFFPLKFPLH